MCKQFYYNFKQLILLLGTVALWSPFVALANAALFFSDFPPDNVLLCSPASRFRLHMRWWLLWTVDHWQVERGSNGPLDVAAAASSIFAYELQNAAHISRYCLVGLGPPSIRLSDCLWLRVLGKAGNPPPIRYDPIERHSKSCHTFDICFGVEHELTVSQAS